MKDDTLEQLQRILETERTALLNGHLDQLHDLLQEKERLLGSLGSENISHDNKLLNTLQQKMARNQTLLENSLLGIRAVADRVSSVRKVRESLETYDNNGHRLELTLGQATKLEKRA